MSDLAKTNDQQLLDLAKEFGIPLDAFSSLPKGGESRLQTNTLSPEGVRTLIEPYKSDMLRWNVPGEKADVVERLYIRVEDDQPLNVNTINGIIVNYQQRDELKGYDGEKNNYFCNVIGYGYPSNPIQELPNVPYGNKYAWAQVAKGEKGRKDTQAPSSAVEYLGVIGRRNNRATPCSFCIKTGLSTQEYTDNKGDTKTATCDPRGELTLAVYSVSTLTKKVVVKGQEPTISRKTYNVSDLYDEQGNPLVAPILIKIGMSPSFIQGRSAELDAKGAEVTKAVVGYEAYLKQLGQQFPEKGNPLSAPQYHFTSVSMAKGRGLPQLASHFEALEVASIDQIREAMTIWKTSVPTRTVNTLTVETFDPSVSTMKSAEPIPFEDDTNFTFPSNVEYVDEDDIDSPY